MLFENRELFPLNRYEKILREIFRILLLIIFLAIAIGCFNHSNNIDDDKILVPMIFTAGEMFCLLYIINAFSSGNLVRRWANDNLLLSVYNIIQKRGHYSYKRTMALATKTLGYSVVVVLFIVIGFEINFYYSL